MTEPLDYRESGRCLAVPEFSQVPRILERMAVFYKARGLHGETWQSVELAIAEGLNNAVEHGFADRAGEERIEAVWYWEHSRIVVEIFDHGDFDASKIRTTLPEDSLEEGGRGHFLMHTLMDEVAHETVGARHRLRMVKTVGAAPTDPADPEETDNMVDAMAGELSGAYESLTTLLDFSETLATSASFEAFIAGGLQRLSDLTSARAVYVRMLDKRRGALDLVSIIHREPLPIPRSLRLNGKGIELDAFRERRQITVEDSAMLRRDDPLSTLPAGLSIHPLYFADDVIGLIAVTSAPDAPFFSAGQLQLVQAIGDFLAIAWVTNRLQEEKLQRQRVEREIEIATFIQTSLLPKTFPNTSLWRVHGVCRTAYEVGGDYFDAIPIGDDSVLLVIADVMGKGVSSAMVATIFRTAIRASTELASHPGTMLSVVNSLIHDDLSRLDMFITAQLVLLNGRTRILTMGNAGHCPVALFGAGEEATLVDEGGPPLGILPDYDYENIGRKAAPGMRLAMFTDGLYEVEDEAGRTMELEEFVRMLPGFWTDSAEGFCRQALSRIDKFTGYAPASDDRTILAMEILKESAYE